MIEIFVLRSVALRMVFVEGIIRGRYYSRKVLFAEGIIRGRYYSRKVLFVEGIIRGRYYSQKKMQLQEKFRIYCGHQS